MIRPLCLLTILFSVVSVSFAEGLPEACSTPWTVSAMRDVPLSEYPRPALRRNVWKCLNGMWEFSIVSKSADATVSATGQIRVPFAIESPLSGVEKQVGPENELIYRHSFEVPAEWKGSKILLNFEAVDWKAEVLVNGKSVGRHQGGYAPFSFDITNVLTDGGLQLLEVRVYDPTDASWQPRGWQNRHSEEGGAPVTGIWGTVWIEPVSNKAYISDLWSVAGVKQKDIFTPSTDGTVYISGSVKRQGESKVRIQAYNAENELVATVETPVQEFGYFGVPLKIEKPHLWSPDSPYLYRLQVEVLSQNEVVDLVESYCGIRTVKIIKDEADICRIGLNGKPIFLLGVRRDGWFPDGGYTVPSDEALQFELNATKNMGFNWIYQHRKVESRRFYYWCDKLGLLVWQEMPGGGMAIKPGEKDIVRSDQEQQNFYIEWSEIIETLRNSPAIMAWSPFGEGHGQSETEQTIEWTKNHDVSRLVNGPSGWEDRGVGDTMDIHLRSEKREARGEKQETSCELRVASCENRAVVLSKYEFVSKGIKLSPDSLTTKSQVKSEDNSLSQLATRNSQLSPYESFVSTVELLMDKGLSGAAYYPYTSGDMKFNGILSFDRKTNNFGEEKVRQLNQKLRKGENGKGKMEN